MEKEIETRLRSKLRIEFSERFHQLQDKYYRQIISVTDNVESSFIDNLKKLSNEAQNNNEREKIQNRIEKIENKIKHEEKKKLKLIKVIKKKESYLTMLNEKIESGLQTQEKLKNTQNSLSNLIKQNYMRNSDLFLELNLTREQNNIKKYYDEEPESFDDFDDQIDFGLSPRIEINDDEAYLGYSTTGTSCFSQGSYDDDIPTMVNLSSSSTKQFGTVEIQSLDQSNNILTT
ncbi:hypothetical protein TRFO_36838 [Tritrichomonas foetus]|uniref:Uncharacterized protein n=1 Tax=Tritrichomonas foetus TaxID=1144522 RepID=A0A1J4JED1_9EUKA|nr:hypothetical protein TRFO_36838 [Tritrichomonas foetus]|eukprot:OHS97009.1 hypothetical protein TRFO_36838 [Tritrichomonas foetus]